MGAIRIKRRSSTGSTGAPATLLNAELAYNEADNTLYYGYGDNGSGSATSVVSIAGQGAYATLNTAQTITGNKAFSGNLTYTGSVDSNANNTQVATTGWVQNRIASSAYSLPAATTSTLGGIIVGNNLSVDANGVLSGVNSYTLPAATTSTLGGVIIGNGLTVQANGSISVNTNYIKDDAANGTLTITGDAGSTTADLLSETTGSHFQSTVNNSGTNGFANWYLKASSGSQAITWGGYGIDTSTQASTISYNYASNFGSGISYGRSLKISGSDITLEQTTAGGASLPTKLWTANSILTQSYADTRYLQSTGSGSIGDLTVTGNLTVNGATTTINSTTISVDDKNIELGSVATPTNTTADGGGITLKGTTDKTINWYNATASWVMSEHLSLMSTKEYRINNVSVLTATSLGSSVVSSSLTSVGTISSGTWQGTTVGVAYGGTGATSITGLVKGNGSSAMTAAVAGTDYLAPSSTIDGGTF